MKIAVAGASGFLGKAVCEALVEQQHQVYGLTRHQDPPGGNLAPGVTPVTWNPHVSGDWRSAIAEADAVINLAGESIAGRRWTSAYKQVLRSSRIDATRALVRAMCEGARRDQTLINASAVGYYGDCGERPVTEECPAGGDFLARLAADWEAEALHARDLGARVVLLRTGLVLARSGGALQHMAMPFRCFVGGPLGSGHRWVPWIHLHDEVQMILWALQTPEVNGPLNLAAPHPVRNRELATELGRALARPALLPVPWLALRVMLGEFADYLVCSQKVVPQAAERLGFQWRYASLSQALRSIYR